MYKLTGWGFNVGFKMPYWRQHKEMFEPSYHSRASCSYRPPQTREVNNAPKEPNEKSRVVAGHLMMYGHAISATGDYFVQLCCP
ncbi:hypothetical protein K443DRAFT_286286 [Laccaria amethystina LaAM-08-1]|uniref:Uncharacterized protein n=1 Tax=Laccaria amethystina LaAM-08-1 TaxID=1095629 RepID=A0A0C9XM66_9AGAR|nr:hypothetical protein K443DRAFT_286286 [Laccaria amethystina LaAM-08-1]